MEISSPTMVYSVLTMVYALWVGWLIVLSELVSRIYQARDSYNFTSLQTGLAPSEWGKVYKRLIEDLEKSLLDLS